MIFVKFLRSFLFGFIGLLHAVRSEQNMRIHCVAAVCVTIAGFAFALAAWEWIAIVFCIGLVISAECMNTAMERLADRVSREIDPLIKQAKDCGSAAVLVLALMAAAIGVFVFAPKICTAVGW
jgi:diacylglycerol kinase